MALIKAARNLDNAVRLAEFLASPDAQKWYAEANGEDPVRRNVPVSEILAAWGKFKMDTLSLARLGELNPQAVKENILLAIE